MIHALQPDRATNAEQPPRAIPSNHDAGAPGRHRIVPSSTDIGTDITVEEVTAR